MCLFGAETPLVMRLFLPHFTWGNWHTNRLVTSRSKNVFRLFTLWAFFREIFLHQRIPLRWSSRRCRKRLSLMLLIAAPPSAYSRAITGIWRIFDSYGARERVSHAGKTWDNKQIDDEENTDTSESRLGFFSIFSFVSSIASENPRVCFTDTVQCKWEFRLTKRFFFVSLRSRKESWDCDSAILSDRRSIFFDTARLGVASIVEANYRYDKMCQLMSHPPRYT